MGRCSKDTCHGAAAVAAGVLLVFGAPAPALAENPCKSEDPLDFNEALAGPERQSVLDVLPSSSERLLEDGDERLICGLLRLDHLLLLTDDEARLLKARLLSLSLYLELGFLPGERAQLVSQLRLFLRDVRRQRLHFSAERGEASRQLRDGVSQGGGGERSADGKCGDAQTPSGHRAATSLLVGSRLHLHVSR